MSHEPLPRWPAARHLVAALRPRGPLVALALLAVGGGLAGCASVGQVTELREHEYQVLRLGGADSLLRRLPRPRRAYVAQQLDTLYLTPSPAAGANPAPLRYELRPQHYALLLDRRFDLDVFTIPVKARPARGGVPIQLNTNFNAALYLGRRLDFYYLHHHRPGPGTPVPRIQATGLGYGAFVGLGATAVTADVTGQRPGPEYEGFVLHAGTAALYDARAFNVGLAVGFDHLLGPDGEHWIYQHRPWFGILFGLDLN